MAGTNRHGALGAPMSRGEMIGGFLYLPLYVIGLAWLLGLAVDGLDLHWPAATINLVLFLIHAVVIVLIFRRWLITSLANIAHRFWAFVQAVILGFVFYYALLWLLRFLLDLLHLTAVNPNDQAVSAMAAGSFYVMLACTVLLAPLVEETLFRGLIFGNLHPKSRILAYGLSALLFAALHVWQYAGRVSWGSTVITAVSYLPAGVALGWTYEKSDTIWASILVHCLINAVSMGILHG